MAWLIILTLLPEFSTGAPVTSAPVTRAEPEGSGNAGFVSQPSRRGTLDILFSALLTIFLCTWTVQHPDIYSRKTAFKRFYQKLKWMVITIFAPEITIGRALNDFVDAWQCRKVLKKAAEKLKNRSGPDRQPLKAARARLAFELFDSTSDGASAIFSYDERHAYHHSNGWTSVLGRIPESETASYTGTRDMSDTYSELETAGNIRTMPDSATPDTCPEPNISLVHGHYIAMGGVGFYNEEKPAEDERMTWTRLKKHFDDEDEFVSPLLTLSTSEIEDKSKADALAKAITSLQVAWYVAQAIARHVQNLPLCTLEILTLGFALCTMIMYAFWWKKPKDVNLRTRIMLPKDVNLRTRIMLPKDAHLQTPLTFLKESDTFWGGTIRTYTDHRIPTSAIVSFLGAGFTAFHLLAWNFNFPTRIEMILWKVSCLTGIATMLLSSVVRYYYRWDCVILLLQWALYIVSRLYLIVAVFLELRSLPWGVYTTVSWANFVPHF